MSHFIQTISKIRDIHMKLSLVSENVGKMRVWRSVEEYV